MQLQHLGDELHLDLAAGAQLHVPRPVGRQVAQHARAHRSSIRSDAVGIASMRQRLGNCCLDAGAQCRRTGDNTGAGQRHALPGPCRFRVVALERCERHRDRALVA